MKKALIIGNTGQDGYYLTKLLKSKGYVVHGVGSKTFSWTESVAPIDGSLLDSDFCQSVLKSLLPDEIYYLAAIHQASGENSESDLSFFKKTLDVNAYQYLTVIETCTRICPNVKVFFASSSHVFGNTKSLIQNEATLVQPISIYGVSKALGMNFSNMYREKGLFCSCGILYNHESPRRLEKFVSKKIVKSAVDIYLQKSKVLTLGNPNARIDWGYAPDYMEAAYRILQAKNPSNYVISSGATHTVAELAEIAFACLGLDWNQFAQVDQELIRKPQTTILQGDNSKLIAECGWEPSIDFKQMIEQMVQAELDSQSLN